MDLIEVFLLLTIVCNVALALFVHFRSSRNWSNVIFASAIYSIIGWSVAMAFYRITGTTSSVFWAQILYFTASFTAPTFLLFSLFFPREKPPLISIFYIVIQTLIIASLSLIPGAIINDVKVIINQEKIINFGWAYPFYIFHIAGFFTAFYVVFFYKFLKYRVKNSTIKLQIQYVLLSTGVISSLAMVTNLFLPTIGIFRFNWLGQILTTFWVGGITYAIIRHRLMDIRLVVARAVAYSILITLIGIFYVGATFVLSTMFLGVTAGINQLFIYAGLTIIVALSFERLRRVIERATDKVFFKGRYDSNELLARLGTIMSTNIELRPLTTQIIQTLIGQMKISRGAFVILGEGLTSIYDIVNVGFPQRLTLFYDQVSPFFPFPQIFVFDELEENHLKSLMREMDVSVVKTLRVEGSVVGLLMLGEKASGEIYSEQDLKVLEILSPEVAVAIQNSQSYDKIKKFNVILSQEVKKATFDLEEANKRLHEVDKLKDEFVSVASHELRTPMSAIRSYAWMTLHRSDVPLSKTVEKYVARILISTERLINLVNDMLNVSRIESGRVEVNPEPTDLLLLVKDIVDELYYSKSEEKRIEFIVLEKPVPKVLADPEKLRQVFLNIVGNSLKFTPAGGKIIFDFFTDGRVVEVSVSDTGVGIPKEDLSKLFHKFSRLDNSYTAAATSGGTGLGLYISKSLIELMHGRIWITSEGVNRGTTVTMALPVATPEALKHIESFKVKPKGEVKGLEPVAI